MLEVKGKYTTAIIKSDVFDTTAYEQILDVCNQEIFRDTQIKIMPDYHAGEGSVIGFTMPITNFVIPNIVGVDIGCGIDGYCLGEIDVNFNLFDAYIRENIPSGFSVYEKPKLSKSHKLFDEIQKIADKLKLKDQRVFQSVGTLGGGNHFIELGKSESGDIWLFIHSGSRNLGLQIANFHQRVAKEFIAKNNITGVQKKLEYLLLDTEEGKSYLHDMNMAQQYAYANRSIMACSLLQFFGVVPKEAIYTTHNYINFEDKILRKGAIQANEEQRVLIPFNMKDGVLIGRGKGNSDWNFSAPHGAGRVLARGQAKRTLDLDVYKETMKDVWSSCVSANTIDESPMAYKPKEEILNFIGETVLIDEIVKPIYNFKAE